MDVAGEMRRWPWRWHRRWWPWSRCNIDAVEGGDVFQAVLDGFEFFDGLADGFEEAPARRAAQTAGQNIFDVVIAFEGILLRGTTVSGAAVGGAEEDAALRPCALSTAVRARTSRPALWTRGEQQRRGSSALRTRNRPGSCSRRCAPWRGRSFRRCRGGRGGRG